MAIDVVNQDGKIFKVGFEAYNAAAKKYYSDWKFVRVPDDEKNIKSYLTMYLQIIVSDMENGEFFDRITTIDVVPKDQFVGQLEYIQL